MATSADEFFPVQFRAAPVSAVREHGFRLDASFHASSASDVLDVFAKGNAVTKPISELADTYGLSDFGLLRIPADQANGLPFFTVSDIQEQEPIPAMFLSKIYEPNLSNYVVSRGTVLVSRSGSVGNVIMVGENLAGKAVANHAIRIIGKSPQLSSLIYVALSGVLGKSLLKNLRYGSVIDQIKSFQISAISIPVPAESILNALHACVEKALLRRDQALQLLISAKALVLAHNQLPAIEDVLIATLDPQGIVEAVELPCAEIWKPTESCEFRLEENFYNAVAAAAIQNIRDCKSKKKNVGALSRGVIMGSRFKRNYVEASYGTPFLSGRNIVQTRTSDVKHLSNSHTDDLSEMLVKRGWILVTCSGTIGRTSFVWKNFEGYAASQHILRVLPNEDEADPAYLYAFLSSAYGYEQIVRFRHGSVIDEITDEQMKKVIVPIPSPTRQKEIGDLVRLAYEKRAEALRLENEAQNILLKEIHGTAGREQQRV
jgi:type I restriction enzyme S subunit